MFSFRVFCISILFCRASGFCSSTRVLVYTSCSSFYLSFYLDRQVTAPVCQYCGSTSKLVLGDTIYPHRQDLHHLRFWQCAPCNAYVGCYKPGSIVNGIRSDGTLPLGILANRELRAAKSQAHAAFDPLWQNKYFDSRSSAYRWLAKKLNIEPEECHIGMFSVDQCLLVQQYSVTFSQEYMSANSRAQLEQLMQ